MIKFLLFVAFLLVVKGHLSPQSDIKPVHRLLQKASPFQRRRLKPEVPKQLCGSHGYNPIKKQCCVNEAEDFHWVTGLFEECGENCGKFIFNPNEQICCNDQKYDFDAMTYVPLIDQFYLSSIEEGCRDFSEIGL